MEGSSAMITVPDFWSWEVEILRSSSIPRPWFRKPQSGRNYCDQWRQEPLQRVVIGLLFRRLGDIVIHHDLRDWVLTFYFRLDRGCFNANQRAGSPLFIPDLMPQRASWPSSGSFSTIHGTLQITNLGTFTDITWCSEIPRLLLLGLKTGKKQAKQAIFYIYKRCLSYRLSQSILLLSIKQTKKIVNNIRVIERIIKIALKLIDFFLFR
jgi:hypothetical protein